MTQPSPKPIVWLVDTLATLLACHQDVQDEVGDALHLAQIGEKYVDAKPLKGLGPGVLEVIADHRGDTIERYTPCGLPITCTFFTSSRRSRRKASRRRNQKSIW